MGHSQINKGKMKRDDPEIDTAQTPKRFDRRLALEEKIRKTFTDCIPNNSDSRNKATEKAKAARRKATEKKAS